MFEEAESNIIQIISHCLHESISNPQQKPSNISSQNIIQHFPDNLNIKTCDITQEFEAGWHLSNNQINCYFGLKFITNNNATKSFIVSMINHTNNSNNNKQTENDLFIQPLSIHNSFISKQIQFEWRKWINSNNQKENGIICRFNVMNQCHQFGIIPFVKCTQFNPDNLIENKSEEKMENKTCSTSNKVDDDYDKWYYEQYLDYYGCGDDYAQNNEHEIEDNENVLKVINIDNDNNDNHKIKQQREYNGDGNNNDDYDEDIDLNYESMDRFKRERKRQFRQFDDHDIDESFLISNPCKRRKFNHCNNDKMTMCQA